MTLKKFAGIDLEANVSLEIIGPKVPYDEDATLEYFEESMLVHIYLICLIHQSLISELMCLSLKIRN